MSWSAPTSALFTITTRKPGWPVPIYWFVHSRGPLLGPSELLIDLEEAEVEAIARAQLFLQGCFSSTEAMAFRNFYNSDLRVAIHMREQFGFPLEFLPVETPIRFVPDIVPLDSLTVKVAAGEYGKTVDQPKAFELQSSLDTGLSFSVGSWWDLTS